MYDKELQKISIGEMRLEWNLIAEYENQQVNTGRASFTKDFELYVSRNGQIAWSPYKDGEPHINPQERVFTNNVTPRDIGMILDEMARFELKAGAVDPDIMVKENRNLVKRILSDFKTYTPTKPR